MPENIPSKIHPGVIDPSGDLCSCGGTLNNGVCPAYPDYANGEHPKKVTLPAIWVCPPDTFDSDAPAKAGRRATP